MPKKAFQKANVPLGLRPLAARAHLPMRDALPQLGTALFLVTLPSELTSMLPLPDEMRLLGSQVTGHRQWRIFLTSPLPARAAQQACVAVLQQQGRHELHGPVVPSPLVAAITASKDLSPDEKARLLRETAEKHESDIEDRYFLFDSDSMFVTVRAQSTGYKLVDVDLDVLAEPAAIAARRRLVTVDFTAFLTLPRLLLPAALTVLEHPLRGQRPYADGGVTVTDTWRVSTTLPPAALHEHLAEQLTGHGWQKVDRQEDTSKSRSDWTFEYDGYERASGTLTVTARATLAEVVIEAQSTVKRYLGESD